MDFNKFKVIMAVEDRFIVALCSFSDVHEQTVVMVRPLESHC